LDVTHIIDARGVSKTFRQHKRFPGISGALRSLVTREFTEVEAVADISFAVAAGDSVGYLGPNGAGKSTMIKMLTGILVPSAGAISVLGREPHRERMRNNKEIGVVFGQRSQLWWDLPVIDSFKLHQKIYEVPPARFAENLAAFSAMLDLKPFLDRAVRQLSLGQRMRAEIVMALLHDPKIVFLDEPTIGLDVVAKDAVRRFLQVINRERGVTILLTSHDLQDIEEICPRLVMVDEGRLLFDGAIGTLRHRFGTRRRLTLEFATDPGPVTLAAARLADDQGARKQFTVEDETISLIGLLGQLGDRQDLLDVKLEEPGIEEVIRTFYQSRPASGG
jgi:ABC-2 type transport system ATP-binding protein